MASYASIDAPIENISPIRSNGDSGVWKRRNALLFAFGALVGCFWLADFGRAGRATGTKDEIQAHGPVTTQSLIKMPSGVNFGSWLSLEDYFFAGGGAVEVATPTGKTVGACLPPLHTGADTGPRWNSETDLLANLTKQTSLSHALRAFHAHRTSFIDWEEDLATLSSLGVKHVRVPLSWCLTDEDPGSIDPFGEEDDESLAKKFTCTDPFFEEEVLWPAGKYYAFLRRAN
jgi:hypothetical protein